jgi:hypothetical protein
LDLNCEVAGPAHHSGFLRGRYGGQSVGALGDDDGISDLQIIIQNKLDRVAFVGGLRADSVGKL